MILLIDFLSPYRGQNETPCKNSPKGQATEQTGFARTAYSAAEPTPRRYRNYQLEKVTIKTHSKLATQGESLGQNISAHKGSIAFSQQRPSLLSHSPSQEELATSLLIFLTERNSLHPHKRPKSNQQKQELSFYSKLSSPTDTGPQIDKVTGKTTPCMHSECTLKDVTKAQTYLVPGIVVIRCLIDLHVSIHHLC